MLPRNVRVSIALSIAEYAALDWYARRCDTPTSSMGRTLVLEALLPRIQPGTLEGKAYEEYMRQEKVATIAEERA